MLSAMLIATPVAAAQLQDDFPEYRIEDSIDRLSRDFLATIWDRISPTAKECAARTMEKRRVTPNWVNFQVALSTCVQKEK